MNQATNMIKRSQVRFHTAVVQKVTKHNVDYTAEKVRLQRFHWLRLQLRTHVIGVRLRLFHLVDVTITITSLRQN